MRAEVILILGVLFTLTWKVCHFVPIPDSDDPSSVFCFLRSGTKYQQVFLTRSAKIDCSTNDQDSTLTLSKGRGPTTQKLQTNGPKITEKNGYFTIKKINFNDGGLYTCTAENRQGTVIKKDIWVFPLPFSELKKPVINGSNYEFDYGESKNFMCKGFGPVNLQWVKWINDSHMEPVPKNSVKMLETITDPVTKVRQKRIILTIIGTEKPWDETIYYACVSSLATEALKTFLVIKIKKPRRAEIKRLNKFIAVSKGGRIEVSCESRGSPHPTIKWYKSGEELKDCVEMGTCGTPGKNYKIRGDSNQKLVILNAHELNTGVITCEASNNIGAPDTRDMRVFVVDYDKFPNGESPLTGNSQDSPDDDDNVPEADSQAEVDNDDHT